ncbi:SDR family NAD(P)-dependent oxidoreductase [Halodurantibacterium flavum]|uniref:SDR family NAD(P)-dependent oxidoreductase n=1 Tax=Halodurantibacterium flavum TaxID=1382802 RepID=A0ABW4S495_9RHOB
MSNTYENGLAPSRGSRLVIVGGCGGIGRVLAKAAADLGISVCVADLPASIEAHPPAPGVQAVAIDATSPREVERGMAEAAERLGGIDGLVNLPGFSNRAALVGELDAAEWDETLAGNLRAIYLCASFALPYLKQSPAGAIVNMASGQGVRPLPRFSAYSAAKAGVISLTKSIAAEHAPVRANAVAPGAVVTAFFTGGTGRESKENTFDLEAYARTVPLGRAATAEDIAGPILFLLGPGAAFVNGQVLHINGGGLMP